jgi:hypothetical protein
MFHLQSSSYYSCSWIFCLGLNRYRKALRMMRHADHHGFPILTFIDTPGAYAGIKAEELGQVISILLPKITVSVQKPFSSMCLQTTMGLTVVLPGFQCNLKI